MFKQLSAGALLALSGVACGYHIMLMAPHEPLQPGEHTTVTLQFADGSSRRVEFLIQGPAARGFEESN